MLLRSSLEGEPTTNKSVATQNTTHLRTQGPVASSVTVNKTLRMNGFEPAASAGLTASVGTPLWESAYLAV